MQLSKLRPTRCGARIFRPRQLSTAAAPAEATSEKTLTPLQKASRAAAGVVAVGSAGAAFVTTERFVHESDFRAYVRSDYASVARFVEDRVLPEYAPRWAHHVRIDDDALEGDPRGVFSEGLDLDSRSLPLATGLVGTSRIPSGMMGNGEGQFFAHFVAAAKGKPLASSTPTPASATAASSTTASSSAASAARTAPSGPIVPGATGVALGAAEALGPIAPDEVEQGDGVDALAAGPEATDEHRDGARWGVADDSALLRAWTGGSPPETPSRLLTTRSAASKFEHAMKEYEWLRTAHENNSAGAGQAATGQQGPPRRSAGTDAAGTDAAGTGTAGTPLLGGRSVIALPNVFLDGSYGTAAADGEDETTARLPEAMLQLRRRALRLQWLRVQEAYIQAEVASLDESLATVSARVENGEGGGVAMQRIHRRRTQLQRRLLDLKLEKRQVKRGGHGQLVPLEGDEPYSASIARAGSRDK